jgi:hypothetical protein
MLAVDILPCHLPVSMSNTVALVAFYHQEDLPKNETD